MQRIGAALWPQLQCIQIYGANTNVGKTIFSTILGTALRSRNVKTNYIKPVSTGPSDEADHRCAQLQFTSCIYAYTVKTCCEIRSWSQV